MPAIILRKIIPIKPPAGVIPATGSYVPGHFILCAFRYDQIAVTDFQRSIGENRPVIISVGCILRIQFNAPMFVFLLGLFPGHFLLRLLDCLICLGRHFFRAAFARLFNSGFLCGRRLGPFHCSSRFCFFRLLLRGHFVLPFIGRRRFVLSTFCRRAFCRRDFRLFRLFRLLRFFHDRCFRFRLFFRRRFYRCICYFRVLCRKRSPSL